MNDEGIKPGHLPSTTVLPEPQSPLPKAALASDAPVRGAGLALTLLVLINLFNYIDRQVLASVEPEIRKEFFPTPIDPETGKPMVDEKGKEIEPKEAGFLMGLLSSAFLVTYMLLAPLFGWLATRMNRWLLVGIGVAIWSLASGASGLASLYLLMFLTRCLVGVGEAVYGPVAPDMISDLYPVKKRGQVMAWFYTAIPIGGALGYALGDLTVQVTGSWRIAFYLVVPPGLLLALWCWFMPEPPRGSGAKRSATLADYKLLLRIPSYVLNTAGMTAMTFVIGGLAFWVPAYLEYRQTAPLFGISPRTAFGGLTALSGLVATILGGLAGDWLRSRWSGSYFLVSGVAMVLAFPAVLLLVYLPFPWAWIPLVAAVFLLFFNTGPTNTILANVTHPLLRALASP